MNAIRLVQAFEEVVDPCVLVLGDLMLDVYTSGQVERISPEAPVLVLRAKEQRSLLGGAASVCQLLRGLDARVSCAGVTGDDRSGRAVRELLDASQVQRELLIADAERPTTVKERFLGASSSRTPSQVLRVDWEGREPISTEHEEELIRGICAAIPDHRVVLISDYAKGVCTPRLCQAVIRAARHAGVPVLVDPLRNADLSRYRGATVLKPNRTEAELAVGIRIETPADALRAGRQLCQQLDLQYAVVTLDRDGIVVVDRRGGEQVFPTTTQNVCDITGAGDMVLAVLGYCVGGGMELADAVQMANVAASLQVQRVGVAVIKKEEIRHELLACHRQPNDKVVGLDQAARLAEMHRHRRDRIVFTNGCFDLLHIGHVAVLTEAAAHGDLLIVGVNSDRSVRRLKGESRPIICETERAAMLAALSCVSYVVVFDDETPHRLLHAIRPDVLVKGGTYSVDQVVGHEVVEAYGGEVRTTPVIDGVSTTNILRSALARTGAVPTQRRAA